MIEAREVVGFVIVFCVGAALGAILGIALDREARDQAVAARSPVACRLDFFGPRDVALLCTGDVLPTLEVFPREPWQSAMRIEPHEILVGVSRRDRESTPQPERTWSWRDCPTPRPTSTPVLDAFRYHGDIMPDGSTVWR